MRYLSLILFSLLLLHLPVNADTPYQLTTSIKFGGSAYDENTASIVVDEYVILTGMTQSDDFLTMGLNSSYGGNADGTVSLFNDNWPLWSRYLGGSGVDTVRAVQSFDEHIYVAGMTFSSDLGDEIGNSYNGLGDGFIAKLDMVGELMWFRYQGYSEFDTILEMAIDDNGDIYTLGFKQNNNSIYNSILLSKLSGEAEELWTQVIDFNASITLRELKIMNDEIYVTGYTMATRYGDADIIGNLSANNGFIFRYNTSGDLVWSKLFGGSSDDYSRAVAVDENNVYITGFTKSNDFLGGNYTMQKEDIFLSSFDKDGNLLWTNIISGNDTDHTCGIVLNDGKIYLMAGTWSTDIPMVNPIIDQNQGGWDGLIFELDASGEIMFSTYIGAEGYDQLVDFSVISNIITISGTTNSQNLYSSLTSSNLGSQDQFYVVIDMDFHEIITSNLGTPDVGEPLTSETAVFPTAIAILTLLILPTLPILQKSRANKND